MASKDLKRAYILPINGSQRGARYEVLFNPAEYSIEKGNRAISRESLIASVKAR